MKARRDGTNTNYNYKWSVWVKWCEAQTRKVDPLHPKVRHMADFWARLYVTRKLSYASLCNYKSTIAYTIKAVRGLNETPFSSSHTIRMVLDGIKNEAPLKSISPPLWDVLMNLNFLKSKIFEPLSQVTWLQLSRKTLFLTCLTWARRFSGSHALNGDPSDITFSVKTGACSLSFILEFRTKTKTF